MEVPRQKLKTYYRINGALYIRRIFYGEHGIELMDRKEFAYIMDRSRSIDIDTLEDFRYAAFLIGGGYLGKLIPMDCAGASTEMGRCA